MTAQQPPATLSAGTVLQPGTIGWRLTMFHKSTGRRVVAVPGMHYRQGDVLLCAIDPAELPADAVRVPRERGRLVLAEGEVTGHAHAVDAPSALLLREPRPAPGAPEPRRFLVLDAPADLGHEEHAAIALPIGVYEVVIQREYVPPEIGPATTRRVVD
jgi:hypothetical protein